MDARTNTAQALEHTITALRELGIRAAVPSHDHDRVWIDYHRGPEVVAATGIGPDDPNIYCSHYTEKLTPVEASLIRANTALYFAVHHNPEG